MPVRLLLGVLCVVGASGCSPPLVLPTPTPEAVAALRATSAELVAAQPPDVVVAIVAEETAGTLYAAGAEAGERSGEVTVEPFRAEGGDRTGTRLRAVQRHEVGAGTASPTPFEMLGRIAGRLAETELPQTLYLPQWTDAATDRDACRTAPQSVFDEPSGPLTSAPDDVVEVQPELIGGLAALAARVEYPETERRLGVEGRAWVQFVVSREGVPECIATLGAPSTGTAEAAMAAVREVRFTPGTQDGTAVRVRFLLPVRFALR